MMYRKMTTRILWALAALLLPTLTLGSSTLWAQGMNSCPNPAALIGDLEGAMAHVRYLADDALEGRDSGTRGARCAADYIAGHFRSLGLEGAGPNGSFFQTFEIQLGSVLGQENHLRVGGRALELEKAWIPFGFAGTGSAQGNLIYGGPGVSMPGTEMDRYAHLDIEGKVVVVEGANPHGSGSNSVSGDPHHKATIAAGRGAAAVIILLEDGSWLPAPEMEERPSVRIPALAISGEMAEAVRAAAQGEETVELSATVEPRMVEVRNVVAMLPGSSPEAEVVIVGAHYDHLGDGGDGSLAPDSEDIHNGADDNASGTAALMEVAHNLANTTTRPSRTVLFMAFTAEEKGLWGSGHYVNNPLLPMEKTVAMMNMDMVGRLRANTLTVYGTGTATEFPTLLEEVNASQDEPFILNSIADGFGASDHSSFYGASVPVLMLFTNTHADYHTPADDWQLIEVEGLNRITRFASDLTRDLAGSASAQALALTYQAGAGNPHGAMAAAADDEEGGRPSRGSGAYMGTIPDMTPQDYGVRITGVREGSPAEKAGLQGGDVLVEFGGHEITDLYAYTYALREFKPGDEIVVVVLRDGERLSFKATLASRS
jgi:aminopeptidase YwaD